MTRSWNESTHQDIYLLTLAIYKSLLDKMFMFWHVGCTYEEVLKAGKFAVGADAAIVIVA